MTAFSKVTSHLLDTLAEAFESGRIWNGDALLLRQYVPAERCGSWPARSMTSFSAGSVGRHIARIIRAVLEERPTSNESKPFVSLVWTGPAGSGATSRDTGVVVRELFMSAKQSILIASFTVHRGRQIFRELAERMANEPNLAVRMFLNI
jgi:hypothetical protein